MGANGLESFDKDFVKQTLVFGELFVRFTVGSCTNRKQTLDARWVLGCHANANDAANRESHPVKLIDTQMGHQGHAIAGQVVNIVPPQWGFAFPLATPIQPNASKPRAKCFKLRLEHGAGKENSMRKQNNWLIPASILIVKVDIIDSCVRHCVLLLTIKLLARQRERSTRAEMNGNVVRQHRTTTFDSTQPLRDGCTAGTRKTRLRTSRRRIPRPSAVLLESPAHHQSRPTAPGTAYPADCLPPAHNAFVCSGRKPVYPTPCWTE